MTERRRKRILKVLWGAAFLVSCGRVLGVNDLEFEGASSPSTTAGAAGEPEGGSGDANRSRDPSAGTPGATADGGGLDVGETAGGTSGAGGAPTSDDCVLAKTCIRSPSVVGDPEFFIRNDGTDVIISAAENGHLYLFSGADEWSLTDATIKQFGNAAPPLAGVPVGYVRADEYDTIVYRSEAAQLIDVHSQIDIWYTQNLSVLVDAPRAAGNPAPYLRSDGFNSIPYRGVDDHIWEIFLWKGVWLAADLSNTGARAKGDPRSFVRADDANTLVFRNMNDQFTELYLSKGSNWAQQTLSPPGAAAAAGDGAPYVRSDYRNALVYRGPDSHVYELSSAATSHDWTSLDLTLATGAPMAAGDPRGYARSDGVDAVVYVDALGHIHELSRTSSAWTSQDLTDAAEAPLAASNARPYVRSDSTNAVVFRAKDQRLIELALIDGAWVPSVVYDPIPAAD